MQLESQSCTKPYRLGGDSFNILMWRTSESKRALMQSFWGKCFPVEKTLKLTRLHASAVLSLTRMDCFEFLQKAMKIFQGIKINL